MEHMGNGWEKFCGSLKFVGKNWDHVFFLVGVIQTEKTGLSLFLGNKLGIIQVLGAFFFGGGVTVNVSPASPYMVRN